MFSRQTRSVYTRAVAIDTEPVATPTLFFFQRRVTLCLNSSK